MAQSKKAEPAEPERRGFIDKLSNMTMLAGLAGGYGAFALFAGRFLYPARPQDKRWMFVATADRLEPGDSLLYRMPSGETVNITRQGTDGNAGGFMALSSVCPHLGCQVVWEGANNRYFCPCHNGTFDVTGKGTGGPPGEAGQSLSKYELKVENDLLYIEATVESLAEGQQQGEVIENVATVSGPGHDPCLAKVAADCGCKTDSRG